jgi:DNA-binding response OmpR family regulator
MVATMCLSNERSSDAYIEPETAKPIPMVLVVDDDCDIRQLVALRLRRHGLNVQTAANGIEALAMLEINRPNLVLLDIMMPGRDGFEVLADMREHGHDVPVVMLSALSRPSDVSRGLDLGANDYVVKPFSGDDLLERVRGFLDTSRLETAAAALDELKWIAHQDQDEAGPVAPMSLS